MSEDQKTNSTGAGAPKKMQQLSNKLKRIKTKAYETELKNLEELSTQVIVDYATLHNVAKGTEEVNSQQMKAIQMRIDRFLKFVEKGDMEAALEWLDTEGEIASSTPQTPRSSSGFTPKVVFDRNAE